MFNDIIIYDDEFVYVKLFIVAKIYFNIWQKKTTNIVNISKKNWMSINTIFNAKSNSTRVFKLDKQNRDVIDKKFDELHKQNKMNWIIQFISYAYFCFVIWKTIYLLDKSSKRKNKIIIDIRNFNKIIQFDVYSMQFQFDLIFVVIECVYINIFDCISFFHKFAREFFQKNFMQRLKVRIKSDKIAMLCEKSSN